MSYHIYPTFNTQGWEESLSSMPQEQMDFAYTEPSDEYPPLALNHCGPPTEALGYEPDWHPAVEPRWAACHPQPGYTMAGPSHVVSGDVHYPQQMLPAGDSYYQAAPPTAYAPTYTLEGSTSHAVQPQYGAVEMVEPSIVGPSAPPTGTSVEVVTSLRRSQRRVHPVLSQLAGAVAGPARTSEGFEGSTLSQQTNTPRRSVRRKTPANKSIPKAVKAPAKGRSRTKAETPAPKTRGKKTSYLTAKYKCVECTTGFGRKAELARHMQWGKAHKKGSLWCDQCHKEFSRPDSLSNHKRTIHS